MKKIAVSLCALALMVGAVSCKKEKVEPINEENPVQEYAEGIYHPVLKIATVSEGGELTQQWSWAVDNLDKIAYAAGGESTYRYSGNYISSVSTTGDVSEEFRYFYDGNKFKSCEVYYDGQKAMTMDFNHTAAGKLSRADITLEDAFLLSMAGDLLGFGSFFEKTLGRPAAEQMILMAKIAHNKDAKFSVGEKVFTADVDWAGENVPTLRLHAGLTLVIEASDLELIQQFLPISEEYLPIIQAIMAMGGGLPLTFAMNDTVSSTFDEKYNPMYCNWGTLISPATLSQNNVLTQTTKGAVTLTIAILGEKIDLYNQPIDDYSEFFYQYNDKGYPVSVTGTENQEYTYKQ